jgi:hypothetical protein
VHVSSQPQEVSKILDAVLDEYEEEPFRFKCRRDSTFTMANVAPWWPRGSAGKTVTVYPESAEHCAGPAYDAWDRWDHT